MISRSIPCACLEGSREEGHVATSTTLYCKKQKSLEEPLCSWRVLTRAATTLFPHTPLPDQNTLWSNKAGNNEFHMHLTTISKLAGCVLSILNSIINTLLLCCCNLQSSLANQHYQISFIKFLLYCSLSSSHHITSDFRHVHDVFC